jgi:hypothetical protein
MAKKKEIVTTPVSDTAKEVAPAVICRRVKPFKLGLESAPYDPGTAPKTDAPGVPIVTDLMSACMAAAAAEA